MYSTKQVFLFVAVVACLAIGEICEARSLDPQQESFLQAISDQGMQAPLDLQQQQQAQQALAGANLDLDDDDDEDDRADQQQQQQPLQQQQLAPAGSALYQRQNEQPIVVAASATGGDLNPAASKHHHHGHGAKGWLDMGAWTGKKGAFGWYDKHPVGKGK